MTPVRSIAIVGRVLVIAFAVCGLVRAEVPAPQNCRAVPDYGGPSITVRWDELADVTGFRLFRAVHPDGEFAPVGPDLPANVTEFVDTEVDLETEYLYMVRSLHGSQSSADSNVFRQSVRVVWPNKDGIGLLHNWNEVLGRAGSQGQPYHRGCDIQQTGETNDRIVFPRGGVVARIGSGGFDDNFIFVEVRTGDEIRYDSFNHLDGDNALSLGFAVGDVVRAGQFLGLIGESHFTIETLDWVDHVHFFQSLDLVNNDVDGQHPLKIFSEDALRDPFETRPTVHDHADPPDGMVLFHRQGALPAEYQGLPIRDDWTSEEDEANIDIHIEIADDMNGGIGATTAPTAISYWIEGRACDGSLPIVKTPAEPYVLLRWDDRFFGFDDVPLESVVDVAQNLGPILEYDDVPYPYAPPPEFGWDNYKHFIVTNSSGTDGDPDDIDDDQYWNTNAAEDGSPASAPHANFAGLPDATRAQDARFPDGDYTIHVGLTDLIGSNEDRIESVQLQNFPPALEQMWVTVESLPDDLDGRDVIHLRFSEPMLRPLIDRAIVFERVDGAPLEYELSWDGPGCSVTLIPGVAVDPDKVHRLTIDARRARDLAGLSLDGAFDGPTHDGIYQGPQVDSVVAEFTFGTPEEIGAVRVNRLDGSAVVTWAPLNGGATYAVSRGLISEFSGRVVGSCLASGLTSPFYKDNAVPPPGEGFAYVVRAVSTIGRIGSLGEGAFGTRSLDGPALCP